MSTTGPTRSVCILGAGAAGLCALRHFADWPHHFSPIVCCEQTNQIGGTWNYDGNDMDRNYRSPHYSSMYRDLRTNLPMQIMRYPDFEWPRDDGELSDECFVHHTTVRRYLQHYADHFDLQRRVAFGHRIKRISREISEKRPSEWKVEIIATDHHHYKSSSNNNLIIKYFDIIILCAGRYSRPYWPPSIEIETFRNRKSIIHSHDYRTPEPYTGKRVAIIGGGPSGADIVLEISRVALEIIFINRNAERQYRELPANIRQIDGHLQRIDQCNESCVRLEVDLLDHQVTFEVDCAIFATGYRVTLTSDIIDGQSCSLRIDDSCHGSIDGLCRFDLVNYRHPTMAILAVPIGAVLPLPLYHQQIQYFIRVLLGDIKPKKASIHRCEDPNESIDRHTLQTPAHFTEYIRALEHEAGHLAPLRAEVLALFATIIDHEQVERTASYRETKYRIE